MNSSKELLFSITADDCRWDYYRGTGAGGQKRNKTSSAVRCTHTASGAVGQSDETRSQHQNKQAAFKKMHETKEFKTWHKLEVARCTGLLAKIEDQIDYEMRFKTKVEVQEDGKWVDEK